MIEEDNSGAYRVGSAESQAPILHIDCFSSQKIIQWSPKLVIRVFDFHIRAFDLPAVIVLQAGAG